MTRVCLRTTGAWTWEPRGDGEERELRGVDVSTGTRTCRSLRSASRDANKLALSRAKADWSARRPSRAPCTCPPPSPTPHRHTRAHINGSPRASTHARHARLHTQPWLEEASRGRTTGVTGLRTRGKLSPSEYPSSVWMVACHTIPNDKDPLLILARLHTSSLRASTVRAEARRASDSCCSCCSRSATSPGGCRSRSARTSS